MGFRPDMSMLVKAFALGFAALAVLVAQLGPAPEPSRQASAPAKRPGSAPIPSHCRDVDDVSEIDPVCLAAWKANLAHFLESHDLTEVPPTGSPATDQTRALPHE